METRKLKASDLAWRGFVCYDGSVIAWPMLLADHNNAHHIFMTNDASFTARWRQWSPGTHPDIDPGATPEAVDAIHAWLRQMGVEIT